MSMQRPTEHNSKTNASIPSCPPSNNHPFLPGLIPDDSDKDNDNQPQPAVIDDIDDESIANVFCFGAFANKNTGVIYNDCTGNFPFMSLDGNICFYDVPLQNKRNLHNAHPWS
jgi:hypothetical protein